jgi:uncharacterized membrane protein
LESYNRYDSEDIAANRGLAAVSYLNPVFIIIALLANPNSRYLRFHINQALLLSLFFIACAVVSVIPILGWIAGAAGAVAGVVFMIIGMVNAYQGTEKELPVIGSYKIIH